MAVTPFNIDSLYLFIVNKQMLIIMLIDINAERFLKDDSTFCEDSSRA
jgi:hypothetical protein